MDKAVDDKKVHKAVDSIQDRLTNYAINLNYDTLSADAIHAAKVRVIDTLGALVGGFPFAPCRLARNMAAKVPSPIGATVIGTTMKTTPDMAAFVNATTARFIEANDGYHWPGSLPGHPSDVIMPVLAIAEHLQSSGQEFITAIVLAYEVYLRLSDVADIPGFDYTNFGCVGAAIASGKLLGLSPSQLSQCISMAVVPHNILAQVRTGHLSMWKAVTAGEAGRAGVFAALLAQEGMEGPQLPFEGKNGWINLVAKKRFSLDTMGGDGVSFRIRESLIKPRVCCATATSSTLAAEKIAPLKNIKDVKQVTVETYKRAKDRLGTDEHHWNPDSRETADHSIAYVTAATLMDGKIAIDSFDDAHLWNADLRALMRKVQVIANDEFTEAYGRHPVGHRTRVTVVTANGERLVGETGGTLGDVADTKSDKEIEEKFRGFTEEVIGRSRVDSILERLWRLDALQSVSEIPSAFVLKE